MRFLCLLFAFACKTKEPVSFYPCPEKDFWYAVMMAESGGNPKTRYVERNGEVSGGLYQLSVGDSVRYGCAFKTEADLYDPKKNEACKDLIAAKLRNTYTGTYGQVLGRYWGTLRSKEEWPEYHKSYPNHKGFENVKKFAKDRGCILK